MAEAITTIVINLFLLAMLGVGFYHSRRIDLNGFSTERGRVGFWPLVGTLVATSVGGGVLVGMVTIGYEAGVVGYVVSASYFVGFLVLGWLSPIIRRALVGTEGTLLDFLRLRFGSNTATLTTLVFILVLFLFLSAQYVAFASFLHFFFKLNFAVAIVLAAGYLILYTALGGLRSVIATDFIQLIAVAVTTVWLAQAVASPSSLSSLPSLPHNLLDGTAYGTIFLVGAAVFLWPSLLVRMDVWQRIGAAKSDNQARNVMFMAGLLLALFMAFYTTMGMVARVEMPGLDPKIAAYAFVDAKLHWLGTLVAFVGIAAAVMSSADSILNVLAICLVKLTPHGSRASAWLGDSSREHIATLLRLRIATVVMGILGIVVAFAFPDIVELNVGAISALLVFLPSVVAGLFQAQPNRLAGFWSATIGTLTILILFPLYPKTAFLPALLFSSLVYVVFARVKR